MTRVIALQVQERKWVEGLRVGDPAAFEELFRAYHPELCDFVHRFVRSPQVAEDLVHDVFAKLWAERERLEVRGSLRSLLYTAARNLAISHLRHQQVERRWRERTQKAELVAQGATPLVRPAERRIEDRELNAAVERVLAQLPERCRQALILRWQRQMTYAEIAEVMGISVKTVEVYMSRGLTALRASYNELLPYL